MEADQVQTFLDAVATHQQDGIRCLTALFEVIALTGMRRGEAMGLRWSYGAIAAT